MTARDLDHLRELRVALAAAADVTRVDAVLGERRGAVRMLAQELMAVEVEVADQRHADTGAIETLPNRRHRRGTLARVDREAHELRPGARERLHLPDRALDVRGVGIGHRLYDDRRAAADADGAHRDPRRSAAGDVSGGAHAARILPLPRLGGTDGDWYHGGARMVCSERVRREPERRRRNSARKRSGTRTADGGAVDLPPGFWRAVGPLSGPPTEWERRQPRLISQVTGQKGGRRGATRPGRLPLFVVFGRRQAVGRRTALFKLHQELGARMVDFGGWDMPVQYSSQIGEHHAVRRAGGVFDVSHMCIVDLKGAKVRALLEQLLANDVTKLKTPGSALYSCMLNERGGVIDDLIVYYLAESSFRAVVNASTRDKDLLWIRRHAAPLGVEVAARTDLAMLAIQGPEARAKAAPLLAGPGAAAALALGAFTARGLDGWFVARTGYTGGDGFEPMMPAADA